MGVLGGIKGALRGAAKSRQRRLAAPPQPPYDEAADDDAMYCKTCGHVGIPARATKGHFAMELVLWLLVFIPGLIYSVWRLTTRHDVCRICRSPHLIPKETTAARQRSTD